MIRSVLMIVCLLAGGIVQSQQDPVLMRVNGKDILRSEFEYSYNQNKAMRGAEQSTPEKFVDSFVNSRLKIATAEAAGMDTASVFCEKLEDYRNQLIKSYLTDEEMAEHAARQVYDKMKNHRRVGEVYVSHIFKYLPQTISNQALRGTIARMDSIYGSLQKNQSAGAFEACVEHFSDEKKAFWVSWLQMPVEFENVVFELPVGEISRPFLTPQGIHIVKVLERKELPPFESIKGDIIRAQTRSHGLDKGTEARVEKLKKEYRYTPDKVGMDELMAVGHTSKSLFTLAGKAYTGKDFARFAEAYPAGARRQLDSFVMKSVLDYENIQLEQKHPELHALVKAFRDKLLLTEITDKEIGKQVLSDEVAIKAYFEKHRPDYHWKEQRYRGIVLHCVNKRVAKQARKFLKSLPEDEWKNAIRLTFNTGAQPQIQAEQGLFAPGDNVFVDDLIFKKQDATPLMSFPFTVVLGEKVKGPEDYREVKEAVISDYQNYLERQWITRLRAAGKVEINQEVLKTVNKH